MTPPKIQDPMEGIREAADLPDRLEDVARFLSAAGHTNAIYALRAARLLRRLASAVEGVEGWVLVPREPTEAMLDAAEAVFSMPRNFYRIYAAMLSASPGGEGLDRPESPCGVRAPHGTGPQAQHDDGEGA